MFVNDRTVRLGCREWNGSGSHINHDATGYTRRTYARTKERMR